MNKKARIVLIAVALALMLTIVIGWGEGTSAETKTVIDQNGRVVEIPKKINRVVISVYQLPAVYYAVTGSCNKIVGIHPAAKSAAETSILSALAPELLNVATGFVKVTDLNIEELFKLEPDIVFFWGTYPKQVEQFDASGIPAVAFNIVAGGNALECIKSWVKLLGEILYEEERASEIIAYCYETMGRIHSRTYAIPRERRPKALFLFRHSAEEIVVPGKGIFGQFWLKSTGAIDVVEGLSGFAPVNMEQIYKWNPDIIYISNFTKTMPEDLLNNNVRGQDWSKVKAVQEGRVYKNPLGIFRWFAPSMDLPLMLKWLAQKHHPEVFADYTMEEEIKEYYSRFYNYNPSDEQVERILRPVPESAKGT